MAKRTFTVATTVQDPLSAERLVEALREVDIDGFSRPGGAASSDGFAAASPGYWDVLVPSEAFEKADALIKKELEAIEADGEENARAAEEESMSGEHPVEK
jgi:hypothetical protein